jgi:UDP-glucose 4-epimerase
MKSRKQIAVVTGGAGFIGSHIVDLLISLGYQVRVIDNFSGGRETNLRQHLSNSSLEIEELDIRQLQTSSKIFEGVDCVYHLAGIGDIVPSIEQPSEYMDVNVQGTVRVLESARASGCRRFIYASSSSCYGLASTPTNEAHEIGPMYPYALSKYLGEQAVFHWDQVYGLQSNSICIFNAYGPRVRTRGVYGAVFGVFLKQKLMNAPLTIVGDGTQSRDFIYVTDVAKAFYLASKSHTHRERFNIGAGKPQSILSLAELIGGQLQFIPKRPGEPDVTWADIEKARELLGWVPTVPFAEGVNRMLQEIEEWRDAPLWDDKSIEKATEKWFHYMRPRNDF